MQPNGNYYKRRTNVKRRIENCPIRSEVDNAATQMSIEQKHTAKGYVLRYGSYESRIRFRTKSI